MTDSTKNDALCDASSYKLLASEILKLETNEIVCISPATQT